MFKRLNMFSRFGSTYDVIKIKYAQPYTLLIICIDDIIIHVLNHIVEQNL